MTTSTAPTDPFSPADLGPLRLRNRFVKAATFEGLTRDTVVSDRLVEFHRQIAAGDAQLISELADATYDGIAIGGFINGQDPEIPPTIETTMWFNRILNLLQTHAPNAKIILVRNPPDALPAIQRVLG